MVHTSWYHHHHDTNSEHGSAQDTTASSHCRGAWWYPSRPDCFRPHTRLFQAHLPHRVYIVLSLVANIGLCLFLFLVGLEIDTVIIRRHARLSLTVASAGVTIPFGFGAALAIPLYHQFMTRPR
ncbi:hypothetical protein BC826DRAFT_519960 [Russula brevipes]|nr:hypothetical protein BC826DRAFT_519960 [Russula brevipes]